jgi:hypothetical protein
MNNELEGIWKEFVLALIEMPPQDFAWKDWRKKRKSTSQNVWPLKIEFWTWDLPNTNQEYLSVDFNIR